jgi:hypothetical protein
LDNGSTTSYTGDGASGLYLFGAQLNTGALAPYVPTTSLAASSTADVASITGAAFAGIWNPSEATLFADLSMAGLSILSLYQASNVSGNRHSLRSGSTIITTNGTNVATFTQGTTGQPTKVAYAYKADDFYYIVGSDGRSDTAGAVPVGIDSMNIGKVENANFYLNGYIRELAIFKSRRPNANLQSMTQ